MKFAPVFQSHMVLQREKPILFFGSGTGHVTIHFASQTRSADSVDGHFRLSFPAMAAGGPYTVEAESDGESVTLNDVLVGEVYAAGGQSNMSLPLSLTFEHASYAPDIRFFNTNPEMKIAGWFTPSPETRDSTGAVACHFAAYLHEKLRVPVGILCVSQGASRMESWMPQDELVDDALLLPDDYLHGDRDYPFNRPGYLFEQELSQVIPLPVRAVLWYQGESNAYRYETFRFADLLCRMVSVFRRVFEDDTLPFLSVLLCPYLCGDARSDEVGAARQAQQLAARRLSHFALISTGDLGECGNIHPYRKREVARRLFLAAMKTVYGCDTQEYCGPSFLSMAADGDDAVIAFTHAEGLFCAGPEITGLWACNEPYHTENNAFFRTHPGMSEGERFYPAHGTLRDGKLIVHGQGGTPVQVRYCTRNIEQPNLFNADGLPAFPFHCTKDGLMDPVTTILD